MCVCVCVCVCVSIHGHKCVALTQGNKAVQGFTTADGTRSTVEKLLLQAWVALLVIHTIHVPRAGSVFQILVKQEQRNREVSHACFGRSRYMYEHFLFSAFSACSSTEPFQLCGAFAVHTRVCRMCVRIEHVSLNPPIRAHCHHLSFILFALATLLHNAASYRQSAGARSTSTCQSLLVAHSRTRLPAPLFVTSSYTPQSRLLWRYVYTRFPDTKATSHAFNNFTPPPTQRTCKSKYLLCSPYLALICTFLRGA